MAVLKLYFCPVKLSQLSSPLKMNPKSINLFSINALNTYIIENPSGFSMLSIIQALCLHTPNQLFFLSTLIFPAKLTFQLSNQFQITPLLNLSTFGGAFLTSYFHLLFHLPLTKPSIYTILVAPYYSMLFNLATIIILTLISLNQNFLLSPQIRPLILLTSSFGTILFENSWRYKSQLLISRLKPLYKIFFLFLQLKSHFQEYAF